jgi:hypothetical protein
MGRCWPSDRSSWVKRDFYRTFPLFLPFVFENFELLNVIIIYDDEGGDFELLNVTMMMKGGF